MREEIGITDARRPGPDGAPLLRAGHNIWRLEPARRAAVLVDAAAYYGALRQVLRQARHSIYIVGWDIDSRTPLVGADGETDDDLPVRLGPFLSALVERRPELSIKLLLWDYAPLYSLEREKMPALTLQWTTPPQVELCLDKMLPLGASHHQKIVVVDDEIAFVGGLDLTIRRWDTPDHAPDNPLRVDPAGLPYPPFHDVHMMVDGEAAAAMGDLARHRWRRVTQEHLQPVPAAARTADLWPAGVAAPFNDVAIGIARTHPQYGSEPEIREVEALFHDMIAAAERSLYIENQFLTCTSVARSLIERLQAKPELEVAIVSPKTYYTWFEQQSMLAGRIRFMQMLRDAGVADRVRLLHPRILRDGKAADVKVHSKLMIVDDTMLRVGSANLCNRSVGLDTECDLAIAAETSAAREGIRDLRNALLAEHCGATAGEVAEALARHDGSLLAVLDALSGRSRQLLPIEDGDLGSLELIAPISLVADPERPLGTEEYLAEFSHSEMPPRQSRMVGAIKLGLMLTVVVAVILAWRYTPLAEFVSLDRLTESFGQAARSPWALPAVLGIFVLGGLVAFPLTLLIAATAAAFGPWQGLLFAGAGALASAMVTYLIGRRLGAGPLRQVMGPRIHRIARKVADHGVLAVTMIRLMPTAPFTLVNLVAGATRIRISDYLIGTALGLAPGMLFLSALGSRLFDVLKAPSLGDILLVIGIVLAWIALSFGLQQAMSRFRKAVA